MKLRILAVLLSLSMITALTGCGSNKDDKEDDVTSTTSENVVTEAAEKSDDDMSLEDLVKAAQDEAANSKSKFMVYAPIAFVANALDAFKETYGIEGEYYRESGQDIYTKLTTEIDSKVKDTADVALMQDAYLYQTQLLDYGYVENYIPPMLKDKIKPEDSSPLVCAYYSKLFIQNNTTNEPLYKNIWELTEDSYKGRVFMKDISKESVNKNFLAMLTTEDWSNKLKDAYKSYYGKDIELDDDCKNAGYMFIKKLLKNTVFGSGDGDIATELSNGKGGNVGLFTYCKVRDDSVNTDNLSVEAYQDTQPDCLSGFMYPIYLSMVKGTDRPYTAKLFIYFMMSSDNFKTIFQAKPKNVGIYSTNIDSTPLDGDENLDYWKKCLVFEDPTLLPQAYTDGVLDFMTYCIN